MQIRMRTVILWIKMCSKSQGRLPTYLLVRGSGPNIVHTCNLFFFFWKKNEYKTCLLVVTTKWGFQSWSWILDMLPRGLMDLKFWTCFLEVRWFKVWTCFPEVWWIWIWMCFPEVRWIAILDVLPRGPMVWSLDVFPRGPMELDFGRASQRFDGLKFGRAY